MVAHLGKLAWLSGGLLLLLGVLAAVLTVELAADPAAEWGPDRSGESGVAALLDSARRMFRVSASGSDEPAGEGVSGHQQQQQVEGGSCSEAAGVETAGDEGQLRQPLLATDQAAGAAQA